MREKTAGALSGPAVRNPRLLVVDDNRDFAENIAELIEDLGYRCEVCSTGGEALEKAAAQPFQVAIVDLQLPDMQGTRVISGLKEVQPDCVCVVFTGNATLGNAIEALNRGAFAYLVKGGEVKEFRAILGKALESHRTLSELSQLRGINRSILENFPGRMLVLDGAGRILLTNNYPLPLAEGGAPAAGALGLEEVFRTSQPWCREVLQHFQERRGTTEHSVLRRMKAPRGGGDASYLNVHFIPLTGAQARWLIFVDDISAVMRLESEMEKSAQLAAMGKLSAVIAHEVRNPLSGISGAVQLLQAKFREGTSEREICDQVISQVDRLDKTIEDLLVLARPMTPELVETSLTDLIDSTVAFLREDNRFRKIEIEREVLGEPDQARLDPYLFRQALVNVMINAAQAMGGEGRLVVAVSCGPDLVEVKVRDSGPGFPEDSARLFEPFYTTKPAGTGLGLPITAKILEVHGGTVSLRNHPRGAEVVLRLPRPVAER